MCQVVVDLFFLDSFQIELEDLPFFLHLQQQSADYELNMGAKLFINKLVSPQQKFVSIIKSFYDSGIY